MSAKCTLAFLLTILFYQHIYDTSLSEHAPSEVSLNFIIFTNAITFNATTKQIANRIIALVFVLYHCSTSIMAHPRPASFTQIILLPIEYNAASPEEKALAYPLI